MTFSDLGIIPPILKAIEQQGYAEPTPIQAQSIPILLEGHDLLGSAQTGTGKTAAFTIPIIQLIFLQRSKKKKKGRRVLRALIISPTRELTIQIAENISIYSRHTGGKNVVIYGGVSQHKQTSALRNGADILIATPGRLLDLIGQGYIRLNSIDYFVLDEADQMLDMGFIHDIKKIIAKLPNKRQSLFFSATMPHAISELSDQILNHPKRVTIAPEQTTAEKVSQSVYFVSKADKNDLLKHLVTENPGASILVFSRTKHGADKIVKALHKSNIKSEAIHGNKSQNARQKTLQRFKKNKFSVLVATDIAARGIDVSKLSLVINYDLPNVPETYVHRIGRTGRAQEVGEAVSFCSNTEKKYLGDIQKLINQKIPEVSDHPFYNPKDRSEFDTNKPKKSKNRSRSSSPKPKGSKKNGGSLKTKFKKNSGRKSNFKKSSKRKKGQ
ncbi:MAG: DEAD/DEAH box helicase [Flavobacteriaceae bacterium]